jgi:TonB family protein
MLELMIRTTVIGGIATVAALLFERGLAHLRLGTRFAWTFALLATLILPWLPRMTSAPIGDVVPQISAPAIVLSATSTIESSTPVNVPLVIALVLSLLVAVFYFVAFMRLLRARRAWRAGVIAREPVFLSSEFGPAVFGFTRPQIVVPEWVCATSPTEQEMIVLHEREHIAARDQLQLLLTIIATALMPWNVFVWLQARALRFRVETDCDQRVLAALPDRARYAELLMDVGSKQNGLLLTPALAEHRNGLERRLTMLASRMIANRWKAAGLLAAGLVLAVVACESRLPQEANDALQEKELPVQLAKKVSGQPAEKTHLIYDMIPDGGVVLTGPDAMLLIDKYYPSLLREAGIGGNAIVGVKVQADGSVTGHRIVKSSGRKELDDAALKVATELKMLPTMRVRDDERKADELKLALTFDPTAKYKQLQPTRLQEIRDTPQRLPLKRMGQRDETPHATPYDVMPELANRAVVGEALMSNYPTKLRDAGIGGRVLVWVRVDEDGKVGKAIVSKGSGRAELDAAALEVAKAMEFKPAKYKNREVPVWIQLPIAFQVK